MEFMLGLFVFLVYCAIGCIVIRLGVWADHLSPDGALDAGFSVLLWPIIALILVIFWILRTMGRLADPKARKNT